MNVCQNYDLKIKEIREKLENGEDKFFEMREGLVYRKRNNDLLFDVPQSMETNILFRYHDQLGHMGVDKVCGNISRHYWFLKLREKVQTHVRKTVLSV